MARAGSTPGTAVVPASTAANALLIGSSLVAAAVPSRWRERALLAWSAALIVGPSVAGVVGSSIGGTSASAVARRARERGRVAATAVEQRAAVFALVIGALLAAQAAAGPVAGYLLDGYGTHGLEALLIVPIIAATVTHLTLTRARPTPTRARPTPTRPAEAEARGPAWWGCDTPKGCGAGWCWWGMLGGV